MNLVLLDCYIRDVTIRDGMLGVFYGIITPMSLTDVGNGQAGCDRGCREGLHKCYQLKLDSCISKWYILYFILETSVCYSCR